MAVIGDVSREKIGTVIAVHNYPTIDALEIRKMHGASFLLPMTKEIIHKIDTDTKQIIVNDAAINELL
jgi:ribosomal 30S subunit maturation factor RimM